LSVQSNFDRLELAQTFVDALGNILLTPLQIRSVTQQLLVLPPHLGLFHAQCFDLGLQVEQAATQLAVFLAQPAHIVSRSLLPGLQTIYALAHFQNGAPRLVILEQGGMTGGQKGGAQRHGSEGLEREGQGKPAHQR
jgi:hypothetical protein